MALVSLFPPSMIAVVVAVVVVASRTNLPTKLRDVAFFSWRHYSPHNNFMHAASRSDPPR